MIVIVKTLADAGGWDKAAAVARSISDPATRAEALMTLMPHADFGDQQRILAEAMNLTRWHAVAMKLPDVLPEIRSEMIDVLVSQLIRT